MSAQIKFFKKPVTDLTQPNVTATASQGVGLETYALVRGLFSAWITTGSVDADNTTFIVDWVDQRTIDTLILIRHNFKSYIAEYWDGAAYQPFTNSAVSETVNALDVTFHIFDAVDTSRIRLTITGTMVANDDKFLYYMAACETLGQLVGWPVIKNPLVSKATKVTKMLSGKSDVAQNVGGFSCDLSVSNWHIAQDIALVERLYTRYESFLVWLSSGDEAQFFATPTGYRKRDIFLMRTANEYNPEYVEGIYINGLKLLIKLVEVTE